MSINLPCGNAHGLLIKSNKDIFMLTIERMLQCRRDSGNIHNPYAVVTIENDAVVGHVEGHILCVLYDLLLRRGGSISCVITGACQYSSDLAQGGLTLTLASIMC